MGITLLVVIGLFGFLFLIMSVGVFFGKTQVKGSCGGIGADAAGDGACQTCGTGSCESNLKDKFKSTLSLKS